LFERLQPSGEPVLRGAGKIAELVDRAQDVANALRELLAKSGQRHLPGAALQQQTAERLLQLLDLHRQGRLRDRAGLSRAAEMTVTRQGVEIPELAQREV